MLDRLSTFFRVDMRYVLRGGAWTVAGRIGVLALAALSLYVFGNYASKETFGAYSYILSMVSLASITTLPGMIQALVRAIAKRKDGTLVHLALLRMRWALLGTVALGLVSFWYLAHGNVQLGVSFAAVALLLPLANTLDELVFHFWQGRERFDYSAILSIAYQVAISGALIATVLLTENLITIISVFFGASALASTTLFLFTKRHVANSDVDPDAPALGFHLTAMNAISLAANSIDKVLVWHLLGPVAVAVYTFAQLPVVKLWQLAPLYTIALPKLSRRALDISLKKKLLRYVALLVLLTAMFVVAMILVAPFVFKLLFPAYMDAVPYLQVLLLTVLFLPATLIITALTAAAQHRTLYWVHGVSALVRITLLIALIPLWGVWGAVGAFVLGYGTQAVIATVLFARTKHIT